MDLGLKDKVALVTGASQGLGRAVALALAAEGCRVAICSRGRETIEAAAADIAGQTGVQVVGIPADLSQEGQGAAFVAAAAEKLGPAHILVANAGGPPTGRFADFGREDWQRAVDLTLFSAQELARAALPAMLERGWGRVLCMSSMSVKQPLPGLMLSNSIRAAVHGWAKSLADEVAGSGVTVNCLCTGWFQTERVDKLVAGRSQKEGKSPQEIMAEITAAIPAGRMGQPAEFGALAAFLAGEQAAYLTGGSFLIDGGFYRGLL